MLLVSFVLPVVFALALAEEEMVPQCLCDQADACMATAKESVQPCMDGCKDSFAEIGDVEGIIGCMEGKAQKFAEMKECMHEKIGGGCADEPGQTIPKLDYEALLMAKDEEMKAKMAKFGGKFAANPLFANLTGVMATMKTFGSCVKKCVFDKTKACFDDVGCYVMLPPAEELKATMKECSGGAHGVAHMAEMCECMADKGKVTAIANICPMLAKMAERGGEELD